MTEDSSTSGSASLSDADPWPSGQNHQHTPPLAAQPSCGLTPANFAAVALLFSVLLGFLFLNCTGASSSRILRDIVDATGSDDNDDGANGVDDCLVIRDVVADPGPQALRGRTLRYRNRVESGSWRWTWSTHLIVYWGVRPSSIDCRAVVKTSEIFPSFTTGDATSWRLSLRNESTWRGTFWLQQRKARRRRRGIVD